MCFHLRWLIFRTGQQRRSPGATCILLLGFALQFIWERGTNFQAEDTKMPGTKTTFAKKNPTLAFEYLLLDPWCFLPAVSRVFPYAVNSFIGSFIDPCKRLYNSNIFQPNTEKQHITKFDSPFSRCLNHRDVHFCIISGPYPWFWDNTTTVGSGSAWAVFMSGSPSYRWWDFHRPIRIVSWSPFFCCHKEWCYSVILCYSVFMFPKIWTLQWLRIETQGSAVNPSVGLNHMVVPQAIPRWTWLR
jgi:hypothetical protein